ncbi:CoxG family protein [Haloferacaceae archaeon DSL9]
MEFEGEFTSEHPPEHLWDYFTDPEILAECAPGCKEMHLVEPHSIEAVISVGVGSVKPTFDVDVTITECDEPSTLKMIAGGDARRNAFDATAEMSLAETDGGGTNARWRTETDVSGLIASMGQRALGSVANRLVNTFFADLEAKAEAGVPAESKFEAAPSEAVDPTAVPETADAEAQID